MAPCDACDQAVAGGKGDRSARAVALAPRGGGGPPSPVHGHQPSPDRGCVPRTIHAVSLNGLPLCNGAPPRTSWRPFRPSPSGKAGQPGGTSAWRKAPAAGAEPLRPVPGPGAPARTPGVKSCRPASIFSAAISPERRDAKAAAETRKRAAASCRQPRRGHKRRANFLRVATRTGGGSIFLQKYTTQIAKILIAAAGGPPPVKLVDAMPRRPRPATGPCASASGAC